MKITSYQLGEHKIIESDNGALWWEAHAGLGAVQSGKCYLKGDILLLGPGESEEPGYLKREFLEKLKRFPKWDRTRYFCSNFFIHDCQSGKKLTESEISEWSGRQSTSHKDSSPGPFVESLPSEGLDPAAEISHKLGQHEITRKVNGQIWWKTYSGSGSLREGRCVVAGEILFLGTGATEESGNLKHAFLERLKQLPQWRATKYYCQSCSVYDCVTGKNVIGGEGAQPPSESPHTPIGGVLIPPARTISSSTPLPKHQRTSLVISAQSFLKQVAAKVGSEVERKIHGACLKYKPVWKSKNIKFDTTAPEDPVHRFSFKKWIARIGAFVFWIGAFILMVALLLLALLHDQWKSWERHQKNHDHSARHDRDH